ncbi:MAG: hypothetical protein ATN35_06095 [Epulopiscium sp. Nele67-Bin004]|nr:MAG: hypothetical protein ATN35_06095 [Epulopiscium sp. Nele67-Bin004]
MKYVVVLPNETLMCFDNASQVANVCMEIENNYVEDYAKDQQLEFQDMTPTEIGFAYNVVGTEQLGCVVYETREILQAMREEGVDSETIIGAKDLFNMDTNKPIAYPSFLDDVFTQVTPVPISSISGNVYTMQNVGKDDYDY